jgi:hypothetical protein
VELLGKDYQTIWHSRRSDDGVGAVLGSRHPMVPIAEIDLRVTPRVTLPWAAAMLAEVEFPPPLGQVLVAHYKPTYEIGYSLEREIQAVTCARALENTSVTKPGTPSFWVTSTTASTQPASGSGPYVKPCTR